MQIIKPYGRSFTETNQRVLLDKHRDKHNIPPFAASHEKLVIAQWVSVIDKIIRKPNPKGKISLPTSQQYQLRETLGKAAWLELNKRLPCSDHAVFWRSKIHPYGHVPQEQEPAPLLQGRWYQRFVGDIEPTAITENVAQIIAERIASHLYEAELRLGEHSTERRQGKITAQAETIQKNVLKLHRITQGWSETDQQEYLAAGDVAAAIHAEVSHRVKAAQKCRENKQAPQDEHRVRLELAGSLLYSHWAKVFRDTDGSVMGIQQAVTLKPGLFALHSAVKDTYSRLLKHSRKRDHTTTLPKTMQALYAMVGNKQQNRDLAALVQLGKVLYYREAEGETVPLANSRFWGSDGQAEIKRAEAFVRVWRHGLGQANLTLANWASLPGQDFGHDSLSGNEFDKHIAVLLDGSAAKQERFDQNLNLVFGAEADLFTDDDAMRVTTIKSARQGGEALRNAAVHFKGRKKFLEALETKLPEVSAQNALLAPKLEALWQRATQGRSERLLKTLEGAHVFHYCTREQVQQLVTALSSEQDVHLPLPRFSRVLERSFSIQEFDNNAQAKRPRYGLPPLPATANRLALEQNPAQKCQYILMKLLYERAFRPWLAAEATPRELERWLETALQRTTNKARSMNAQGGKDERELVLARAAKLPIAFKGNSIHQFFHDLSAATASEMRVQRGYQSDATQAQEQSAYIDELLRDVVALAFKDYLNVSRLRWLLEIDPHQALPQTRCCSLDQVQLPPTQRKTKTWQQVLYFLLHLMPVGEVSQLLHQLAKWEVTAKRGRVLDRREMVRLCRLQRILKLYLDMHDSQYTGNELMPKVEREVLAAFNGFYENPRVFAQVFENQGNERDSAQYLPQRGLREIRRFGHIPVLTALGGKSITAAQVKSCLDAETAPEGKALSAVAVAQQQREKLHHDWVTNKLRDTRAYCEALADVIRHRHLATHIRLTDRVTAHRIVMKVLARLADFSGLFERDLTFVTLALLHEHGLQKADFFKAAGLKKFDNGQIIEALSSGVQAVRQSIKDEINTQCAFEAHKNIRNALAHFNMLHSDNGLLHTTLDLTYWVNQTRTLMAYDRKLKNAVSQSIMELLEREGFILKWEMDDNHKLVAEYKSPNGERREATIVAKTATHLRGLDLPLKSNERGKQQIREALHSHELVALLAGVFGIKTKASKDITTLNLDDIDWKKMGKPKKNG